MSTTQGETHYKILGLNQNCTTKEVRDAFVNMSKIHHPDRHSNNPDSGSHTKFVKINEAYSVLSKPDLRRSYDFSLVNARGIPYTSSYRYRPPGSHNYPDSTYEWRDETIERGRAARSRFHSVNMDRSYYGVEGFQRKPNSWVAGASFILIGVGVLIHLMAYKYASIYQRAIVEQQQEIYYSNLDRARRTAMKNGNDAQLEKLKSNVKDFERKPF